MGSLAPSKTRSGTTPCSCSNATIRIGKLRNASVGSPCARSRAHAIAPRWSQQEASTARRCPLKRETCASAEAELTNGRRPEIPINPTLAAGLQLYPSSNTLARDLEILTNSTNPQRICLPRRPEQGCLPTALAPSAQGPCASTAPASSHAPLLATVAMLITKKNRLAILTYLFKGESFAALPPSRCAKLTLPPIPDIPTPPSPG